MFQVKTNTKHISRRLRGSCHMAQCSVFLQQNMQCELRFADIRFTFEDQQSTPTYGFAVKGLAGDS